MTSEAFVSVPSQPFRQTRAFVLVAAACALFSATGCDDGLEPIIDDLSVRGERYCEIMVVQAAGEPIVGDVYSSYELNDCPDEAWQALDTDALAQELGVFRVILSGPRYWTTDDLSSSANTETQSFGGIEMRKTTTVSVSASALEPYQAREIERTATFGFFGDRDVYELTDPGGQVYVMQSYSTQTETNQTLSALPILDQRLTLPTGWSYNVKTLDSARNVVANGRATVVQDNFGNTYQLFAAE